MISKIKKSLFWFIFAHPFLLQAQQKFSIDLVIGEQIGYRWLRSGDDELSTQIVIDNRNGREKPGFFPRYGLDCNIRLNEKTWFKTGLRLAREGYLIQKTQVQWGSQNNNGVWDPSLPSGEPYDFIRLYGVNEYLEIPLTLRKEYSGKKLTPYVEGGLSLNYYLASATLETKGLQITRERYQNDYIRKFHPAVQLSFGLNHRIGAQIMFFAQATIRQHIIALGATPVREFGFNAGLETGLRLFL